MKKHGDEKDLRFRRIQMKALKKTLTKVYPRPKFKRNHV